MKTATIDNVTQDEFDSAVQLVIAAIKASDPKLDTRIGTVLRSLLVNPEARIEATAAKQIEYVRKSSSLKAMKEAADAGETVDADDVNAVLSNFNISSSTGTFSSGIVKVTVEDGTQSYTIPEGSVFKTIDGLEFAAGASQTAALTGGTTPLYEGASSYFFLVPVTASEVGADHNIVGGTSLTTSTSIYTFISAEAYRTFSGGSDVADIGETIDKIPSGLSIRGFVNKSACEGMLRDKFDSGSYPILACSTVGYGNSAQRRDKHNLFGVGVGGRIDLYVRNFGDLCIKTETLEGTVKYVYTDDGETERIDYEIPVPTSTFPGACWIKSVSCVNEVNSTLAFSCSRTSEGTSDTWHDFDVSKDTSETFNTVWQGFNVVAEEVPPDTGADASDSSDDRWSTSRKFLVTAYCLPQAAELQSYVDRDDVRSVSTDVVVRCPAICNVTVSAKVVYDTDNPLDVDDAKYKIRKYINSLGFVKSLTRSEIVHILKECGAVSVDLDRKDMLYGVVHDAYGNEHDLSGDALVIDGLAPDGAMLTSDTTVFAAEPENIQLTLVPNN